MDINALLSAAQNDPAAAQFIQQLLAGGSPMASRMPEIKSMVGSPAPEIVPMATSAPMPVFADTKETMDELLAKWAPKPYPTDGVGGPMQGPTQSGTTLDQMMAPQGPQAGAPDQAAAQGLGQGPADLVSMLLKGFMR